MLELLDWRGGIVTIRSLTNHARGCQREIARPITSPRVGLITRWRCRRTKVNCTRASAIYARAPRHWVLTERPMTTPRPWPDQGHGRVARRQRWAITATDCLDCLDPQRQWLQLRAVVRVVATARPQREAPGSPATTSAAWSLRRNNSWPSSEATGASQTRCAEPWT